jgi:hypothetical protein
VQQRETFTEGTEGIADGAAATEGARLGGRVIRGDGRKARDLELRVEKEKKKINIEKGVHDEASKSAHDKRVCAEECGVYFCTECSHPFAYEKRRNAHLVNCARKSSQRDAARATARLRPVSEVANSVVQSATSVAFTGLDASDEGDNL